jgi:hypothetical protein
LKNVKILGLLIMGVPELGGVMAEEATRPFDHRAAQGDATGLADRLLDGAKPLITLAFERAHRVSMEIRNGVGALVELLLAMFRRPVGARQLPRTANRFENFVLSDVQAAKGTDKGHRFRALLIEAASVGKSVLREAAECACVVLILGCRYGLAACRVVYHRALEFHRDGKVELTKGEAAIALLVLACFGFSLAWLISDTDPRTERLAGASPTDGGVVSARDVSHKTDPIRAIVPDIPTKDLAELLAERPSLEGRLYWAEQPMPLPMLAVLPDREIRLATTTRSTPVPREKVTEITIADAPAKTVAPPTDEAQPGDVPPPPTIASPEAPQTTIGKPPQQAAAASTGKPKIASGIPPEPPAPARDKVSASQPRPALVPPPPRPEPLATAGMGSTAIYQVQLVAVRARAQAWKMWESLLGRNEDVLGDLEPDISSKRTRNRRPVYRLRAGPIDSKSAASELCATLSKRKVDCLVIRANG